MHKHRILATQFFTILKARNRMYYRIFASKIRQQCTYVQTESKMSKDAMEELFSHSKLLASITFIEVINCPLKIVCD